MTTSILLERTRDALPILYRRLPDPQLVFVFAGTELHDYQAHSPIWLQPGPDDGLLEHMHSAPGQLPGLIIESQASEDVLLAHLRHILLLRFGQGRRGVLRYWNTTTASYFFTHEDPAVLAAWMGPIDRLSWHGGTWMDRAQGTLRRFSIDNPQAAAWTPLAQAHPLALGPVHEQALQRQQREHFAYQWWQRQDRVSFIEALQCLERSIDQGFAHAREFEDALQQLATARAPEPLHRRPAP